MKVIDVHSQLERYKEIDRNRAESEASLNAQCPCGHPVQLKMVWEDGKVHCWECEWWKLDAELSKSAKSFWLFVFFTVGFVAGAASVFLWLTFP